MAEEITVTSLADDTYYFYVETCKKLHNDVQDAENLLAQARSDIAVATKALETSKQRERDLMASIDKLQKKELATRTLLGELEKQKSQFKTLIATQAMKA